MSKAQNQTYTQQLSNGTIQTNKARVFRTILNYGGTLTSIHLALGIPEKTVSGRLSELYNEGVISIVKTFKTPQNTTASIYRVELDPEQIRLNIQERKKEKFLIWIASGLSRFDGLMSGGLESSLHFNKNNIENYKI